MEVVEGEELVCLALEAHEDRDRKAGVAKLRARCSLL